MQLANDPIRVLHVDDEPEFAEMVATFVTREDNRFDIETATSASEGLDRLASDGFDCVVSDYDMPGQNGIEFLEAVREGFPELPFVLFTGKGSEEIASDAISAGVTDYLQKGGGTDQYTVLANRIGNLVEKYHAEREAERTRSRLEAISANSSDAILMIDTDSVIRFANAAAEDLFGYASTDLTGESLTEIMPPRYRDEHFQAMARYLETGERTLDWNAIEFLAKHRDGHELPVSVSFSEFEEEGERRFVGIIRDISDRVRIEEELREREQRFRQMAENISEVVWMSDPEKEEILYTNPTYEEIWGRSVGNLYDDATSFLEAIHPEDRDRVEEALDIQTTGNYDEEYRIVRPDGEVRWIRDRAIPIKNDAGEIYRIVGIASDVTERKEREQEHERVVDLLDHTERIADVGGWEIDTETEDVFWSNHLFEMLRVEDGEEPPLDEALDVYVEADRPRVENAIEAALAAGEPFDVEARFERPDGEIRWFQIQGEPRVEGGEVVTLRGAVQDITEHKNRETQLEETTSRLEALFENSPDMIDVLDPDGTLRDVNQRFCEELGYAETEVLGRPIWEIDQQVDEDDVASLLDDFDPNERRKLEGVYRRRDGSTFPVEVHLLQLDLEGKDRFLAISRDISERKKREVGLEQRNQQLEEFASVVSHDLRNPLNVAQGRLELAQENCDSEHLDDVGTALERSQALIDDLLTLARDGNRVDDIEAVDFETLAENCWRNVATGEATVRIDSDRTLRADKSRLQQLLENLYRNAIEHGDDNGTVTVGDLSDGFYIEDNGPGIPTNKREDVFDVGFSTAGDGTGFGLSIVKQIVNAHGWEIAIAESETGGTRIEITGVDVSSADE